jgi:16S rRNA (cytidine1402-2'-O)-methyltransferase
VAAEPDTLVCYESPHRLLATLDDVAATLGAREVAAAGELTQRFEEVLRGPVDTVREHFHQQPPRGEFTLVIAGAAEGASLPADDDAASSRAEVPGRRRGRRGLRSARSGEGGMLE